MSKSYLLRTLAQALREKAGWFTDPPVVSRAVTVRIPLVQLRQLRAELDRAAFALDEFAEAKAREEGAALAQVPGEQWRVTERKKERASALADALLEDRKYELR